MPVEFLSLADRRIAYQRELGEAHKSGIVFLSGFASDMEGSKAAFLAEKCRHHSLNYVRFDYSGCGQSPGSFKDGTIGTWYEDALAVISTLTIGPQILIGSSMGGWLSLLLAQAHPNRIKAIIGVAAAPDFTEDLVWTKLSEKQRETLRRDGALYEEDAPPDPHNPGQRMPMTLKLIEEARAHLFFDKPAQISCPVHLLQGLQDHDVPSSYAQRIANHIGTRNTRVTLIDEGDHRLSTQDNLDLLWHSIEEFL